MNIFNMRKILVFIILLSFTIVIGCKKKQVPRTITGKLTFVLNDVKIKGIGPARKAKTGDIIKLENTIITGKDSLAIMELGDKRIAMEIQSNASVTIKDLGNSIEVYLQKGNVWTRVKKSVMERDFYLKTPTTIAAVRGTKFYSFWMGDIQGTCACEGTIRHGNLVSKTSKENHTDYIVFQKGKKTVYVTREDLKKIHLKHDHEHSQMDNSPLGKKFNFTKKEIGRMVKFVSDKFKNGS